MNKLVRDGKVAVVHSRRYGVPFAYYIGALCMDGDIALAVEIKAPNFSALLEAKGINAEYIDINDLKVSWVDEGEQFIIREHDGCEWIELVSKLPILVA